MKRSLIITTVAAAAALLAATPSYGSSPAPILPPLPSASAFGSGAVNAYFPLIPGTTSVFSGTIDGTTARESVTVTRDVAGDRRHPGQRGQGQALPRA